METITLEQIYFIGQTISAIAVILSLIYVGLQVRQNTHTIRLSNVQALSANLNPLLDMIANSAELADIYHRGNVAIDSLDDTEQVRFRLLATHAMRSFFEVYEQMYEDAVRKETWVAWTNAITEMMQLPGMQTVWSIRRSWFPKSFQDYIDGLIESIIKPQAETQSQ